MGYLDESGLARYDGLIKNWVTYKSGTVDGIEPLLNWQKTGTASSVAFYPLPAALLDPVVNFVFTETGPEEGTKGPDNPSTITGVSEIKVTRANSNLIRWPYYDSNGKTADGITWTINDDGSVSATGTSTSTASAIFRFQSTIGVAANGILLAPGIYRLSGCPSGGVWQQTWALRAIAASGEEGNVTWDTDFGSGANVVVTKPAHVSFFCSVWSGNTVSNLTFYPKLQLVESPFEKNEQDVYTLSLGSIYYGGSVDLSAGTMTVTRKGMQAVASFSPAVAVRNGLALCILNCGEAVKNDNTALACTRFSAVNDDTQEGIRCRGSDVFYNILCQINISRLDFSSAIDPSNPTMTEVQAAFAVWLAANPMDIVFRPVSMPTVQLTPAQIYSLPQLDPYTPRLNTVYSDQTSVQVGYPKSPLATAAELTNAIVSLGSNL